MLWRLLRQHISVTQLVGFFIANLCGMVIVMLGIQFYNDVSPVFTQEDSFIKKDIEYIYKLCKVWYNIVCNSKKHRNRRKNYDKCKSKHSKT